MLQAMTSKPTTMYIWVPEMGPMLLPSKFVSAEPEGADATALSVSNVLGPNSLLEPPCHAT